MFPADDYEASLQKGRDPMDKFIPKEKMSKKAKKKMAVEQRGT
jgi:hypothetical protein